MLHKEKPDYFIHQVNECKKLLCEDGELQDYLFGVVIMAANLYKIKGCDDEFFELLKEEVKRISKILE